LFCNIIAKSAKSLPGNMMFCVEKGNNQQLALNTPGLHMYWLANAHCVAPTERSKQEVLALSAMLTTTGCVATAAGYNMQTHCCRLDSPV
jgi:hypothetical protein